MTETQPDQPTRPMPETPDIPDCLRDTICTACKGTGLLFKPRAYDLNRVHPIDMVECPVCKGEGKHV